MEYRRAQARLTQPPACGTEIGSSYLQHPDTYFAEKKFGLVNKLYPTEVGCQGIFLRYHKLLSEIADIAAIDQGDVNRTFQKGAFRNVAIS